MKKVFYILAFSLLFSPLAARAETVLVVDQNNVVRQQIYTYPNSQQVVVQQSPQVVYQQPAPQVIVQQPPQQVVVVRPQPQPRVYYYDHAATSMLAGFTGAIIGNAIFGHHHHHHRHHRHRW